MRNLVRSLFTLLLLFSLLLPLVFSQDIPPTVDEGRLRIYERNVEIDNYVYWTSIFLFLIVVLGYFYLLSRRYIFSEMSSWLKGGLSLVILEIILFFIFYVYNFIGIEFLDLGSELSGLVFPMILMIGLISIIPVFLIGALVGFIIGKIINQKQDTTPKNTKIGFIIGLVLGLSFFSVYVVQHIFRDYFAVGGGFPPASFVIPLVLIFSGSIIGWLIGKFVE